MTSFETQLVKALAEPVESLFEAGGKDTCLSIRKLLKRETEAVVSEFSTSIAGFELDEETIERMQQSLRDHGRKVVENKAREEAGKILIRMKDR
ncbi:protein ROOT HAIR DEFECTIVE 3 homolog 2-like [Lotus japonicus]|uniref:protein ROOT HAIR DEFECTIVE 3 homolog 2-like n=1 Tax=Lotus japonicus TaxID=34305 RepID=UPI00258B7ED2|nr:protein ROOT HAIR DEFECTIVE 3 homolog 2-like [Lotus japonicus]